jgi:ubiquitin carboxyl-terminal hydrolase 5/13
MHKLADGLLCGRNSRLRRTDADTALQAPSAATPQPVSQEGVTPVTFKTLVGGGHAEFATMRHQGAEEFFTHLLTSLGRYAHANPRDSRAGISVGDTRLEPEPTETFAFALEQRLQCTACAGVRYRVDARRGKKGGIRGSCVTKRAGTLS